MSKHPAIESGNVAVITGAGDGIGLAAVKYLAARGLKVCLADIDRNKLDLAEQAVAAICVGGKKDILTVQTDVGDLSSVERLRDEVYATYGQVNVLMNNAGTAQPAKTWSDYQAWQNILQVNLWGVINGVQTFTDTIIAQNLPACIINTASKQGITCPPGNTAYNVSKTGVKALTEGLAHDLRSLNTGKNGKDNANDVGTQETCKVSAHLLVPGFTYTGMVRAHIAEKPASAWLAEEVVSYLFERVNQGDFYIICPDNDVSEEMDRKRILWSAGDLTNNRPALSRWHPDYQSAFAKFMTEK